ncbi:MAG: V-type ATP synthase subunit F [Clostridia bacterium]|nr:V-type ATP synthase subunit F [Clostridia bacterium]
MPKICMIGDRDSVLGFMALGYDVHEAYGAEEAAAVLHRLARNPENAVIFITEQYAALIEEDIARYKDNPLPAIVSVPGAAGTSGYGMRAIKTAVERAVGADILFKE